MLRPALDLRDLTEKTWDLQLFGSRNGLATMLGWTLRYHTLRSQGSTSGFPDRILVRDRLLAVELKTETGKVSDAQAEWLDGLAAANVETYLWRPGDLDEIGRILASRGRPHTFLATAWLPSNGRADTIEQQTLLTKGAA